MADCVFLQREVKQYRLEEMAERIENLFGNDCRYEPIGNIIVIYVWKMFIVICWWDSKTLTITET